MLACSPPPRMFAPAASLRQTAYSNVLSLLAEPEDDFEAGPSDEEVEEDAGGSSGSGSDEELDAAGSSGEEDEQEDDFGSGEQGQC